MYLRPKKIFWTIVVLAALLYGAAHAAIRSSRVQAWVLRGISAETGYRALAGDIRLTPSLALLLRDFRLVEEAEGLPSPRTLVSAPYLRLSFCCRKKRFVRASRAELTAWRDERDGHGVWTPTLATGADDVDAIEVPVLVSPSFKSLFFELSDTRIVLRSTAAAEPDGETVYEGVDWSRLPVRLAGRPGAVQNRISARRVGGVTWNLNLPGGTEFRSEWFELDGGATFCFSPLLARAAAPAPDKEAEAEPEDAPGPAPEPESAPAPAEAPVPAEPVAGPEVPAPAAEPVPPPASPAPAEAPVPAPADPASEPEAPAAVESAPAE